MREKKKDSPRKDYHIGWNGYKILLSLMTVTRKREDFLGMLFTDAWLKILEIK